MVIPHPMPPSRCGMPNTFFPICFIPSPSSTTTTLSLTASLSSFSLCLLFGGPSDRGLKGERHDFSLCLLPRIVAL